MARPVKIQNEAILEAARKVFLAEGYGASTAKVAKVAGVSEGSIFKHFQTKTDLFSAAMAEETGVLDSEERLIRSAGTGNIRDNLEKTCGQLLQHLQIVIPRLMMMRSSGISMPFKTSDGRKPMLEHIKAMTCYFKSEIKAGRLRMQSPEVAAHTLLGSLTHYVVCDTIYDYRPVGPQKYVSNVVDLLLAASMRKRKGR